MTDNDKNAWRLIAQVIADADAADDWDALEADLRDIVDARDAGIPLTPMPEPDTNVIHLAHWRA